MKKKPFLRTFSFDALDFWASYATETSYRKKKNFVRSHFIYSEFTFRHQNSDLNKGRAL